MANKFFMMVAVASVGCIAFAAPENWFNGGLGSESASVSGGAWQNASQTGVTKENYKYVLDEPENPLAFAATNAKLPEGTNLTFSTTANFKYSYDELPAVDADAKAGVVVYTNRFYVLGINDGKTANEWKKTSVDAGTIDSEVSVSVVVTNGNNSVFATYTIGSGTPINTEVYVKSDAKSWNTVSYKGCGVVASLAGQYEPTAAPSYPIPGSKTIPADKANAWAAKNYPGLTEKDLADMLASSTEYNGRTAAESCILGVKTNDVIDAEILDEKAAKLSFSVNCEPIEGRATFTLKKNGSAVGEAHNSPDFEVDIADGIYTIVANVDGANKEIAVSQEIGVKGTAVESGKVKFIGALWDDCSIKDLMKNTCCADGDKLEYFNAASQEFYTWTRISGVWSFTPESGKSSEEPSVTLKKGQAVKYTSTATTTLYEVGNVTSVTSTPIVQGVFNLVACPGGDIAATALPIDNNLTDKVVVLGATDGATASKVYRHVKSGDLVVSDGYNATPTKVTEGSVSGGFFVLSKDRSSITWPAK